MDLSFRFARRAGTAWGRLASLLLIALPAAACAGEPEGDARSQQLADFFAQQLRPLAASRPASLSRRLDEMSGSPFLFLRGAEALFDRDLGDPALPFARTAVAHPPVVLLQGDAHVENLGTTGPRGDQRAEWNDFDAAGFGPFHWEVRRAGAALLVGMRVAGAPPSAEQPAASALARAYLAAVRAGPGAIGPESAGAVLKKKFSSALDDGESHAELVEFTESIAGSRRLRRGVLDPSDPHSSLIDAPAEVAAAAASLVASACPAPAAELRVKDVARRCGQGVGSLTAVRLYVLVEGASAAPDDDVIVQIKEATDASLDRTLPLGETALDSAARVLARMRALQSRAPVDRYLASGTLLDLPVVITTVSGFAKSVRVEKDLQKASDRPDDLAGFGADIGRLLGEYHARSVTPEGAPALAAIESALAGLDEAFVAETIEASLAYADQTVADHARFVALRPALDRAFLLESRPISDVPVGHASTLLDPECP